MMKIRSAIVIIVILMVGYAFFFSGHVKAQEDQAVRVIKLSNSGYEEAHGLSFSSDGKILAVGGTSGVYLYDSTQLSEINFIKTGVWARSVTFLPGENVLAAALYDDTIKFWDVPGAGLIKTLDGPRGLMRNISVSSDGSLIASASEDETLRVWKVADGSSVVVIDSQTQGLRGVALSPDGTRLAGALGANTVRVWTVPDGKLLYTLEGHTDWVRCLTFSPDGKILASGGFDKNILLWSMADGKLLKTLTGHTSSLLSLAFSPDGNILASGDVDKTVHLWNVSSGTTFQVLLGHTGFVYSVAFSPDGKTLASGDSENTVRLWDMDVYGKPSPDAVTTSPATPSDCRVCHHPRGQAEAPRVIGMRCEACHQNGANLEWCPAFPRSTEALTPPVSFKAYPGLAGVPIGGKEIAILIASPSNGETLYAYDGITAAAYVVGQIQTNKVSFSDLSVELTVWSGNQKTTTLTATPSPTGQFKFNLSINPQGSIPYIAKPNGSDCLPCHEDFRALAPLPDGEVRLSVTVSGPDGQQASDERWIKVDASKTTSQLVEVVDAVTQQTLPGLPVQASTVFYEWRSRFDRGITDTNGMAQLKLNTSSQFPTIYQLSVPKTVYHGKLYASDPVSVTLKPGETGNPTVKVLVHTEVGQLHGTVIAAEKQVVPESQKIWAVQLPTGPAYQVNLDANNKFSFNSILVGQYLVSTDPYFLAQKGLSSSVQNIDLSTTTDGQISIPLSKSQPISGTVVGPGGDSVPFAWAMAGGKAAPVNPVSGIFLFPDFSPTQKYITVSAPGFYSLSQPVDPSQQPLVFKLHPRPETQQISWGTGIVVVPPEAQASISGLDISLDQGWLWGKGSFTQPLKISLPGTGAQVEIFSGDFALESPAGSLGWLYIRTGSARVTYVGDPAPVDVSEGQMIALVGGSQPLPFNVVIVNAFHPVLDELPLFEVVEPGMVARVQNWLVKAGISVTQVITFITYILSLVTIIALPLYGLFLYRKKRQVILKALEKK